MFVGEIIVEGFKTYAARTVISGFDPTFNAITGLNGSGKSNILDAICFVLGITNLSQVRVHWPISLPCLQPPILMFSPHTLILFLLLLLLLPLPLLLLLLNLFAFIF